MQSSTELGFADLDEVRDRMQLAMVSALARANDRIVLKGGMAMRAFCSTTRMTKDVDFDCPIQVPVDSLERQVTGAMSQAARGSGVRSHEIVTTKKGEATLRVRLTGSSPTADEEVRWVAEVSRRRPLPARCIINQVVVPPKGYHLSPFHMSTYSAEAMLASKVAALQSDNRNVPRDIYDLNTLMKQGNESPRALWTRIPSDVLATTKNKLPGKIDLITFAQAEDELLPYLPPREREYLHRAEWEGMQLEVSVRIDAWIDEELQSRLGHSDDAKGEFKP